MERSLGEEDMERIGEKYQFSPSIGFVIYVIILTLSRALHRSHPWGHFTDGVTEALRGTHSKLRRPCGSPGLVEALHILQDVEDIGVVELTRKDIVRHKLVTRIVNAFERYDKSINKD